MKVLVVHNEYRMRGGEDAVATAEVGLLRDSGVEVRQYFVTNSRRKGLRDTADLVRSSAWSGETYRNIRRICSECRPDVAHVHNFWMALTPSAHEALHDEGIPTVQTLHNFRLICANALLLRNGSVCDKCVGKTPWKGILHRCYRNSMLASAAVVRMLTVSRSRGIWTEKIDAFIALSESSRNRFVAGGIPAEKIFVKPNFVAANSVETVPPERSHTVVYAGRLSEEKGVRVLLSAWAKLERKQATLIIAGDGPLMKDLREIAAVYGLTDTVQFAGHVTPQATERMIAGCRAVILPSICLENFPRTLVEAFACGRGVIAADIGALREMVEHGKTGLLFHAGDGTALAVAIERLLRDDALAARLGEAAIQEYEMKYTPSRNLQLLLGIYDFARQRRRVMQCGWTAEESRMSLQST